MSTPIVILLLVALVLAIPTYGISIVLYFVLWWIRAIYKVKIGEPIDDE